MSEELCLRICIAIVSTVPAVFFFLFVFLGFFFVKTNNKLLCARVFFPPRLTQESKIPEPQQYFIQPQLEQTVEQILLFVIFVGKCLVANHGREGWPCVQSDGVAPVFRSRQYHCLFCLPECIT